MRELYFEDNSPENNEKYSRELIQLEERLQQLKDTATNVNNTTGGTIDVEDFLNKELKREAVSELIREIGNTATVCTSLLFKLGTIPFLILNSGVAVAADAEFRDAIATGDWKNAACQIPKNLPLVGPAILVNKALDEGNYEEACFYFIIYTAETAAVAIGLKGKERIASAGNTGNVVPTVGKGAPKPVQGGDVSAKTPIGKKGRKTGPDTGREQPELKVVTRNTDTIIEGRKFSGHALDQMQSRGIISPSVISDAIKNPAKVIPGKQPGTWVYFKDDLKVIANESGDIITVMWQ